YHGFARDRRGTTGTFLSNKGKTCRFSERVPAIPRRSCRVLGRKSAMPDGNIMDSVAVTSGEALKPVAAKSQGFAPFLKLAVFVIVLWVLFWNVLKDMAHDWWIDPAWSQGMLLPPLALYVAWLHRAHILGTPAKPDSRGILLTGLACCLFVLGKVA